MSGNHFYHPITGGHDHHHHGPHSHDHHHHGPHSHDHHHDGPGGGRRGHRLSRRAFLGEMSAGTVAVALFSPLALIGCGDDTATDTTTDASVSDEPIEPTEPTEPTVPELRWERANLGFVSAYVLARGNEAAIVDTGVAGSGPAIGLSLAELGLNYNDVRHVILTHKHADHAGALDEVMSQAVNARVYAGEADLDGIGAVDIESLVGGEDVFGFEMVSTPGHTAGHMAAFDQATGLLIAGDAVFTDGGAAVEGPERFFEDVEQSRTTLERLSQLSINTLLVGHGTPIEGAADQALRDLVSTFG